MRSVDIGPANHGSARLSDRDTYTHQESAIDSANLDLDYSRVVEQYHYLQDNEVFTDEDLARLNSSDFTSSGDNDSPSRSGITPATGED